MSSHDAEDKNYEDIMAFAREVCKNDRATLKNRRNAWKKDDTYYLLHGYRYILSAIVLLIVFAINFTAAYQNAVTMQLGKNMSKNKFHSLDTDSDGCMDYSEVQSSFMIVSECVFESMKRQQTFDTDNDGCLEIDEVCSLRQQFFASNLAKRTKSQFREWLADPKCVPDDDVNDRFSVPIKTNVYAGYQLWNIANRSVMRDSMNEVLSQFDETWKESLTLPSETNISPAPTGKNANNGLLELLESLNLEHLGSPLHEVLEISSTDDMQYFLPQDCQLLRDAGHPLPLPMCRRLNAVARKAANWHHTDIEPVGSQQLKPSTKIKLTNTNVDSIIHSMCLELRNEGCLRKQFPWKILITISVTTMCICFPFVV